MQNDPAREWQRLTRLYGEMSDEELQNLAASFGDLTEFAQPILRDELRKRGLAEPAVASISSQVKDESQLPGRQSVSSQPARDGDSNLENEPAEYTWKTVLCECKDWDEAWNISDALRRAGIESWEEGPRGIYEMGPRVLVPADRLDEARVVASSPIPQEVIDLHTFVPSRCPKCGAEDPLLQSVEPTNTWTCETCGAQWSDSAAFDPSPSGDY